jgi:hypothetical protein
MPNIPAMYDSDSGTNTSSGPGETTATATPSPEAPTEPARGVDETTSPTPATAPNPSEAQPGASAVAPAKTPESMRAESWGTKVYHGVLNALGGGGDVSYSRDPNTGKMIATPVATGPGTQWKKIIAGALTGASAAAAAGTSGPDGPMRGAGAGIAAGMHQGMQRDQLQREHADQDFEAGQKAATENARRSLLAHQIAESTFNLGRARVNASVEDAQREQDFEKVIRNGGAGTRDLQVFPDFASLIKATNAEPQLHEAQAKGLIHVMPHVNSEGKIDGIRAAVVTPTFLESPITKDLTLSRQIWKDGKEQTETYNVPAGSLTGQQYMTAWMAQGQQSVENHAKTAEADAKASEAASRAKLVPSEIDKNEAEAFHMRTESKVLNEAADQNTINSNAQQLVEGSMDPSNLSKRSKSYDPTLAAANSYSMAKYGKPFDIAKAMGDYKFATNVGTYNTLNFLNSLTGRDNQSGNLGEVLRTSDLVKRSKFPPLNKVELWAKLSAGHPEIVAYRTALVESADQAAKILQGGGTGNGTSDTKLKQALDLLDQDFNVAQMRTAVGELRPLLANRKKEIIGDNRYLVQWHGISQPGGGPPAAGAAPQLGSKGTVSLAAAQQLPQYKGKTAAEVKAAAEQLGYTVTQ